MWYKWQNIHDYVHMITLHKIVTPTLWGVSFFCWLWGNERPCWEDPCVKELMVTSSQKIARNWEPQSNNPHGMDCCQNHLSSEANSPSVQNLIRTQPQLISWLKAYKILKQKAQLNCVQAPDLQKLWDNMCWFKTLPLWQYVYMPKYNSCIAYVNSGHLVKLPGSLRLRRILKPPLDSIRISAVRY